MKNALLILSLLLNIGLAAFCVVKIKTSSSPSSDISIDGKYPIPDYKITSKKNFKEVYFEQNDSLYKDLWNEAFENEPEEAFLISCSYFYVTKDTNVVEDIKTSVRQLEEKGLYNRELKILEDTIIKATTTNR
jgi:hypothetical protein